MKSLGEQSPRCPYCRNKVKYLDSKIIKHRDGYDITFCPRCEKHIVWNIEYSYKRNAFDKAEWGKPYAPMTQEGTYV